MSDLHPAVLTGTRYGYGTNRSPADLLHLEQFRIHVCSHQGRVELFMLMFLKLPEVNKTIRRAGEVRNNLSWLGLGGAGDGGMEVVQPEV